MTHLDCIIQRLSVQLSQSVYLSLCTGDFVADLANTGTCDTAWAAPDRSSKSSYSRERCSRGLSPEARAGYIDLYMARILRTVRLKKNMFDGH
jgi:hypothetical protein